MRQAAIAFTLALSCMPLLGCGQAAPRAEAAASRAAASSVDSTVVALEREKLAAFARGDFAGAERFYSADFAELTWTGNGVARKSGAQSWADVRKLPRDAFASLTVSDFRVVRATPDAAVVSYLAEWPQGRAYLVSVWARGADGWKTVFYEDVPVAGTAAHTTY